MVSKKSTKYNKRYLAWLITPNYFRVNPQNFVTAFFPMLILSVIVKNFKCFSAFQCIKKLYRSIISHMTIPTSDLSLLW